MNAAQTSFLPSSQAPPNVKFRRKRASSEDWQKTLLVIDEWNRLSGQSKRALTGAGEPTYDARMVLGAVMREGTGMSVADYADVIRRNLAAPWWDGTATIPVVFSPKVWERSRECTGAPPPERERDRERRERREREEADLAAFNLALGA